MGKLESGLTSKALQEHLQLLRTIEKQFEEILHAAQNARQQFEQTIYTDRSIIELELSVRSYNFLENAKITTIQELRQFTKERLRKEKHFPKKIVDELEDALRYLGGFKFGSMSLSSE